MLRLISRRPSTSFLSSYSRFLYTPPEYLTVRARNMQAARSRPPSEEPIPRHMDKKPRLDVYQAEEAKSTLDAPVEAMNVDSNAGSSKAKSKMSRAQRAKDKKKRKLSESGSPDNVVYRDVLALLGEEAVQKATDEGTDYTSPFQHREEVELVVSQLTSDGESLSKAPDSKGPWAIITPFALPGETIRARVYRHARLHSYADLIEIVKPNLELRDDTRVKCKYFGKCAGCQYQMLSYETQLDLKRNVVVKAYQNFSDLPSSSVPGILPTIGSPLQYGYRTKITPHFDAPHRLKKKSAKGKETEVTEGKPDWFNIGFNQIGTKIVMDIEECPIATPVLNEALGPIRENIIKNIHTYKKGVSLLLRESMEIPSTSSTSDGDAQADPSAMDVLTSDIKKICITDHKGTIRERVGDMLFEYTAGSFFQNNNCVLVPLTSYVRDTIFPPDAPSNTSNTRPTHLVDAYCGSGLFAITLSPNFQKVAGIELSTDSIACANKSASLNNLPSDSYSFLQGDASNIFATVQDFPRDQTVLIIDPPRKGSDEKFIDQLIEFGCAKVVYVSCNVHTQARDVGMILSKSKEKMEGREYVIESVRGFDLFPQTAHVESVAVLKLVKSS